MLQVDMILLRGDLFQHADRLAKLIFFTTPPRDADLGLGQAPEHTGVRWIPLESQYESGMAPVTLYEEWKCRNVPPTDKTNPSPSAQTS
jgi:hypothetical protein